MVSKEKGMIWGAGWYEEKRVTRSVLFIDLKSVLTYTLLHNNIEKRIKYVANATFLHEKARQKILHVSITTCNWNVERGFHILFGRMDRKNGGIPLVFSQPGRRFTVGADSSSLYQHVLSLHLFQCFNKAIQTIREIAERKAVWSFLKERMGLGHPHGLRGDICVESLAALWGCKCVFYIHLFCGRPICFLGDGLTGVL